MPINRVKEVIAPEEVCHEIAAKGKGDFAAQGLPSTDWLKRVGGTTIVPQVASWHLYHFRRFRPISTLRESREGPISFVLQALQAFCPQRKGPPSSDRSNRDKRCFP